MVIPQFKIVSAVDPLGTASGRASAVYGISGMVNVCRRVEDGRRKFRAIEPRFDQLARIDHSYAGYARSSSFGAAVGLRGRKSACPVRSGVSWWSVQGADVPSGGYLTLE